MMVLNIFSLLLKIAIDIYTVIFGKWYICIYISLSGKNQIQHVCNICIALHKFEYSAGVADWRPFPTDGFQSVQDSSVRKEERVWVFFSSSTTVPQSLGGMTQSTQRQLVTGRLPAGPEQHPPLELSESTRRLRETGRDWRCCEVLTVCRTHTFSRGQEV